MRTMTPSAPVRRDDVGPAVRQSSVSKTVGRLGIWSAILSAVFSVAWFVTFTFQDAIAPMPSWEDIDAYAAAFTPARILYVYPSLLLALSFIVLLACIHRYASEEHQVWSLIGLAIGVLYATMASINYTIQAVAVRQSLESGETAGIAMFLPDNPHSVFNALSNSYVYMALAMLFLAPVFGGGGLERWIRWIFLAQGLTAITQIGWSMFGLSEAIFIAFSMIWIIGAPVAFVLLALMFKRVISIERKHA